MTEYLDLVDYLLIAEAVTGIEAAVLAEGDAARTGGVGSGRSAGCVRGDRVLSGVRDEGCGSLCPVGVEPPAAGHDIQISHSGVWGILKRLELNRLPASQRYKSHDRRWKRYEKPLPGHRVQVFTLIRVLRVYPRKWGATPPDPGVRR